MKFQIEKTEKYNNLKSVALTFEDGYIFVKNKLGYILSRRVRKDNKRILEKLVHTKEWETFVDKVRELKI